MREYQIHLGKFISGVLLDWRSDHFSSPEHRVDSIRQTVQCYSDISTIPWIWNQRHQRPAPDAHTTHMCRNFQKIQSWARDHAFTQEEYDIRLAAQQSSRAD
jgi:hypothetical protein